MMNAGYTITKREEFDHEGLLGIAYGEKESKFSPTGKEYVTWMYRHDEGETDYFFGHYFDNEVNALKDYHERLLAEYNRMEG